MEKSQYDLCIEVLHRLDKVGVLKDIVLVGSWCTLFYKSFFGSKNYMTSLSTRDMDLFIPQPRTIKTQTDTIQKAFQTMPKRWQARIKRQLADITDMHILEVLEA